MGELKLLLQVIKNGFNHSPDYAHLLRIWLLFEKRKRLR
jgi:hypothetical protein